MKNVDIIFGLLIVFTQWGCAHENVAPEKLRGIWHTVHSGETVESVAARYGASSDVLSELNDLPDNGSLQAREEIFVPKTDGNPPGTGAPPPAPLRPQSPGNGAAEIKTNHNGTCKKPQDKCMSWPAPGKVSSFFGERANSHHDGIDITGEKGSPIVAAADGNVIYSGDAIKGYGNLLIVNHSNGVISIYAHNDENLVKEGDIVKKGQIIAKMGNTGSATGVHLHFEVRVNEQPQDPLVHLIPR